MKRIFSIILALAALVAPTTVLAAQDPVDSRPPADRPRIALVLSGGGARGLAHVGVLQELERMRVPVDIVTGTSMGAIIGGLFAAGLSPDSIAVVARTAEWDRLLADTPPRDMLDARRRAEGLRYTVELEMGWGKSGPRLPPGLIAGQAIGLYLRNLTLPVAHVEDFDDLPIPFACMATDLELGESVVLDQGDLVQAIRASMAIPVVFSPVEIDGRLLVDGGVLNNLPVDLARSMGADVVIAIDASPRLKSDEDIATLLGVTEQLSTIVTRRGMEPEIPLADIVITPELEGFGPFDFAKNDTIIARGEASVLAQSGELARWALSPDAYAAWRRSVAPPALPARIDEVRVEAPPGIDPRRVLGRAGLAPGDTVDPQRLERAAELPFGTGEFERVEYDLAREDGQTVAVIGAVPQPWGRDLLRVGARFLTDSGGADLRTGLLTFRGTIGWVRRAWNARGGESRIEAHFGQENALKADWYQPIDFGGRWFVEPAIVASWLRQPLYVEEKLDAEYDIRRFQLGVDGGLTLGRSIELRTGLRRAWVETETEGSDVELLPEADDDVGALSAAIVADRLEGVDWPRHGVFARAELLSAREGLGSDGEWERLAIEGQAFRTFGGTTAFLAAGMGSALGTDLPPYEEFLLGGLHSLSGYGLGELRGRYAAAFRAGGFRQVADLPPSFRGVLLGAWVEAGRTWMETEDIELDDLAWAGTIAAGAETVIGSIILAYGRAEHGRSRVTFGIGLPWAPPFGF